MSLDARHATVALLVVTLRPVLKSAARRSTTATARYFRTLTSIRRRAA
ncbi:hypothetical protein ACFSM7_00290 [Clavibacter michiganensis subsp. tessellarius]